MDSPDTIAAASSAMERQDWLAAVEHWREALGELGEKAPPEVLIGLSTALRKLNKFQSAESAVRRGLDNHPHDLALFIEFAEIATANQEWSEAARRWQFILQKFSDKRELGMTYARLISAYCHLKEYDEAQDVVNEALKYHAKHPAVRRSAAALAAARQEWPAAAQLWQAMIKDFRDEVSVDAWIGLSAALRRQGQFEQADITTNDALQRYTSDINLLIEQAEIPTTGRDWPEALRRWQVLARHLSHLESAADWQKLHVRFNLSVVERIAKIEDFQAQIARYQNSTGGARKKVTVYTSVSKGYDSLKLPERIDRRFNYVIFTDDPRIDGLGVYDVRPLPVKNLDNARAIRYAKTHPHVLFPQHEAAIWVDTSIMVQGNIVPLLNQFMASGKAIGNFTHYMRQSVYEEFEASIELGKADYDILKRQMWHYKRQGFENQDLSENGILFFNLGHERLGAAMEAWWQQILDFSTRDQLSLGYALSTNGVERYHLADPPITIRNHPNFILTPHFSDHWVLDELYSLLRG